MKKLVIVIAAIMLYGVIGFAQDKDTVATNQNPTNTETSTASVKNPSATCAVETTAQVTSVGLNKQQLKFKEGGEIQKLVDVDSLVFYRNKNADLHNHISDLQTKIQELEGYQNYIIYAMAGLFIVLLILLIVVSSKSKKRKEQVKHLNEDIQYKKESINELVQKLQSAGNNTADKEEIDRLKSDIEYLRKQLAGKKSDEGGNNLPPTLQRPQIQPVSLYADAIIDGKFNRVKEQPNEDTIFELKLNRTSDSYAKVIVYESAYPRVIANPSFLEGCEKQILGHTTVSITKEGSATKESDGKWRITARLEVKIS